MQGHIHFWQNQIHNQQDSHPGNRREDSNSSADQLYYEGYPSIEKS